MLARIRTQNSQVNLSLLLASIKALAGTLTRLASFLIIKKMGRNENELKNTKQVLKNVKKSKAAVTRAKSDPSLAKRLRERYGIK